jgi:superoxide dismutase
VEQQTYEQLLNLRRDLRQRIAEDEQNNIHYDKWQMKYISDMLKQVNSEMERRENKNIIAQLGKQDNAS